MCSRHFIALYKAFLAQTGLRSGFVEQWAGLDPAASPVEASEDDAADTWLRAGEVPDEAADYNSLFSSECRTEAPRLYRAAMSGMRGRTFDNSRDLLRALVFVQHILAVALWKHHLEVGELESFIRGFDRLDVKSERLRLHALAQENSG